MGGRFDADVGQQQGGLELLERLIVEHAAAKRTRERAGQPVSRHPKAGLQPIGPRIPR